MLLGQHLPSNDQPSDLFSAVTDFLNFCRPIKLVHFSPTHEPMTTMNLDRFITDPHTSFTSVHECRSGEFVNFATTTFASANGVGLGQRAIDQSTHSLNRNIHLGKFGPDHLKITNTPTKLLTAFRILDRELDRTL